MSNDVLYPENLPPIVPCVNIYAGDNPCSFGDYTFEQPEGTPRVLTGWTFTAHWRISPNSQEFYSLQIDASRAAIGKISIFASGVQTAGMTRGGVWDLQGVNGTVVETFAQSTTAWFAQKTRP